MAPSSPTLFETLLAHADSEGGERVFLDLPLEGIRWSFRELAREAVRAADALLDLGAGEGQVVVFAGRNSGRLVAGLLGAQAAGLVPSLDPPLPSGRADVARNVARKGRTVEIGALLVDETCGAEALSDLAARLPFPVRPLAALAEPASVRPPRAPRRAPLAGVQFTSGSVLAPRGVRISHENVVANCRAIQAETGFGRDGVCVGWLPLFDDMGLVGLLASSLVAGGRLVLTDPSHFVRDPLSWLRLISEHRASDTIAPHFAYALAARRAGNAPPGLDLSSLRQALNGSEPITRAGLDAFVEAFSPYGLAPAALRPAYGLAEATLAATFAPRDGGYRYVTADRERLETEGTFQPAPSGGGREIASVGVPVPGIELRLVDPATGRPRDAGHVGEIELRGPSISDGYAGEPLRASPWLKTGDLGFMHRGELYVTGRLKELIKVAGRSVIPQDLEDVASGVPHVRAAAAFEIERDGHGAPGLAVETNRTGVDPITLALQVRRRVLETLGLSLGGLWLVAPRSLPKTSSGKLQRRTVAGRAESGLLGPPL